ncbi:hypothetical protein PAXINDRAFT_180691 [Paxillus involutus ATCC 200175]|uniref:Uncharacterized protein n=1 Tax=Paxillus involutus ATCC 200175 TaxID=664439 RepID=A0A0C9TI19_PAXIN|nr:hypothetical protein PAXINDRAFT_180691 [Paxillus involutus ATCC 200175]
MLTFDKNIKGFYRDIFPLYCPYTMHTTFQSQFAVVKPQAEGCTVGEQTILTKDKSGVYHFSDVVEGEAGYLEALNSCPELEDMAVGFTVPTFGPDPPLQSTSRKLSACSTWSFISEGNIGPQTQFKPVLRAYIIERYQQTEIIETEVSAPFSWEQDLARLSQKITWVLAREEPATYKLTQESVERQTKVEL